MDYFNEMLEIPRWGLYVGPFISVTIGYFSGKWMGRKLDRLSR